MSRRVALLALSGCALVHTSEEPVTTTATECISNFAATLETWERFVGGAVSAQCRTLDADLPPETSVHECIHALSACAYGDPDVEHLRGGLWLTSRPTNVETEAQAAAQCL